MHPYVYLCDKGCFLIMNRLINQYKYDHNRDIHDTKTHQTRNLDK